MKDERDAGAPGRLKRLVWFVSIWAASVAALGVVAYLFRWVMDAIGLGKG